MCNPCPSSIYLTPFPLGWAGAPFTQRLLFSGAAARPPTVQGEAEPVQFLSLKVKRWTGSLETHEENLLKIKQNKINKQ